MANININNVNLRVSAGYTSQFPGDPISQVAFSGRSNVGKSSLINMLLGRKSLARVSSAPGKTITVNFYEVDKKLFLADLPGYGFARRSEAEKKKWSELTDGYFTANPNIDRLKLVVQLIDGRIGPTDDDAMMIDYLARTDIPYIIVATKTDKLSKKQLDDNLAKFRKMPFIGKDVKIIPTSSQSGEGKNAVWQEIFDSVKI